MLLKPSNGKNPVEPKNEIFVSKMYTFNITKCDKIMDLFVANGQFVVPKGAKVPLLEQRKKSVFCKFHNILGHKTSQCVFFRDLVQNSLKDDKLKFVNKKKLRPEEDVEMKVQSLFVEPVYIMVFDTIDEAGDEDNKVNYEDQATKVYPKDEEKLVEILNCFKLKDS